MGAYISFLSIGLLVIGGCALQQRSDNKPTKQETLKRVVIIGASASAGYGTGKELGQLVDDVPLSEFIKSMIKTKDSRVINATDGMFLIAPELTGMEMVKGAMESKPTCVIAIDFLFWYALGKAKSIESRQQKLAQGLQLLEKFKCPLVISELLELKRYKEIVVKTLNRQIREWAGRQKNVILAPFKEKLADLRVNKPIKVAATTWSPPGALAEILQKDKLHPTLQGLGLIAALALESLAEKGLVDLGYLTLDSRAITGKVIQSKKGGGP